MIELALKAFILTINRENTPVKKNKREFFLNSCVEI